MNSLLLEVLKIVLKDIKEIIKAKNNKGEVIICLKEY